MTIFTVPIEPLEERYSAEWLKWFREEYKKLGVTNNWILGEALVETITRGAFLDVISTNHYKAIQLARLCKYFHLDHIKDGDVIFIHDLWFPGLEMLAYIRDGLGIDFKIVGCLHAGTYDPHDFITKKGMWKWGEALENSWFTFVDKIFVATSYHKRLICRARHVDPNKIVVTGLPIYPTWIGHPDRGRQDLVVFPHRLDAEKNPAVFDELAMAARTGEWGKGWEFVRTKDICKTKKEYFMLLQRSKIAVSFAEQETWGIAMQEALFAGCIPIVPSRLSYYELYDEALRYRKIEEFRAKLRSAMAGDHEMITAAEHTRRRLIKRGAKAIPNILEEISKL